MVVELKGTLSPRGCKNLFFPRPLLEQNYMHGSISIENISFSRNCDIKTIKLKEHHRRFYLGKVYF